MTATAGDCTSGILSLQIGAFASPERAAGCEKRLHQAGFPETTVLPPSDTDKQPLFRVLLGSFTSAIAAEPLKRELLAKGFRSVVWRPSQSASQLSTHDLHGSYFVPLAEISTREVDFKTLPDLTVRRWLQLETKPSKSMADVESLRALARQMPETHPLRARLSNTVARKTLDLSKDVPAAKALSLTVANGACPAASEDLVAARKFTARILHYHEKDRSAALRAYSQILREAEASGDRTTAGEMRTQIVAILFETARDGDVSIMPDLMTTAATYYKRNSDDLAAISNSARSSAPLAGATARLGLMEIEIALGNRLDHEAERLADEYVSRYGTSPYLGEVASAYCLLAKLAALRHDGIAGRFYADAAITVARMHGKKTWADPDRDPLWLAYQEKLAAIVQFAGGTQAEADALVKEIKQLFPDHPSLKQRFPH